VGVIAVPLLAAGLFAARPLADLLTGSGSEAAIDSAAEALPWMVVAGVGQFTAGLRRRSTTTSWRPPATSRGASPGWR
jgi:hypothetical protein